MVFVNTKGCEWPLEQVEQVELAGGLGALSSFRREPQGVGVSGSNVAAPATTEKMCKRT
jgi:hypothetical protein